MYLNQKKYIILMLSNTEIEIVSQEKYANKIIDALKALVKSAICQDLVSIVSCM